MIFSSAENWTHVADVVAEIEHDVVAGARTQRSPDQLDLALLRLITRLVRSRLVSLRNDALAAEIERPARCGQLEQEPKEKAPPGRRGQVRRSSEGFLQGTIPNYRQAWSNWGGIGEPI
jgi:hypothetical protein